MEKYDETVYCVRVRGVGDLHGRRCGQAQETAESLRQKRHDLDAKIAQINTEIRQIRQTLTSQGDLAEAQKALDAAQDV